MPDIAPNAELRDHIAEHVAKRFQKLRRKRDIPLSELALMLGVNVRKLTMMEAGYIQFPYSVLAMACRPLDVHIQYFLQKFSFEKIEEEGVQGKSQPLQALHPKATVTHGKKGLEVRVFL